MIPTHLGRYRILKRLAAGGMGEVFLARQEGPAGFAKPAVIKRILGHLADEPGFVELFLEEAKLAALLAHPNVVQIFELGEADGAWFIAMEYLDGRSLRALRKEAARKGERLNPVQAARILGQALEGLHYAHQARGEDGQPLKIVHRDISPDNIFVGFNGVVKVLDFGIAKAATAIHVTRTGEVKGKFAYMAPEQLRGLPLDGRTDVYSAGVVLYELLAGERPYAEDLPDAAMSHHILDVAPPPLGPRAPQAPAELCALVMKALEKDAAFRFQTAEEFSSALENFVASVGEANTNTSTASYMKLMFGEAAVEDLVLTTPAPDAGQASRILPLDTGPSLPAAQSPSSSTQLEQAPAAVEQMPVAPAPAPAWQAKLVVHELPSGPAIDLARQPVSWREPALDPSNGPAVPLAPPPEPAPFPTAGVRRRWPVVAVAACGALVAGGALWKFAPQLLTEKRIEIATVVINSDPPGATLRIDGEAVGRTPWTGSNVWTGEVKYELSAPGRQAKHGTFQGGRDVEVTAKLLKK